jgi:hypothetical protein
LGDVATDVVAICVAAPMVCVVVVAAYVFALCSGDLRRSRGAGLDAPRKGRGGGMKTMVPDCRRCEWHERSGFWFFGTHWCMRPVPDAYHPEETHPRNNECKLERTDRLADNCGPAGKFFKVAE